MVTLLKRPKADIWSPSLPNLVKLDFFGSLGACQLETN